MGQLDPMAEVARKYNSRVEFLFIYCRESHAAEDGKVPHPRPDLAPLPQAKSMLERTEAAKWFADCLRPRRRVVVDEFTDRSLKQIYGGMDDPTVVVDVDGKVALKLEWSDAALLDAFLAKFLEGRGRVNQALAACLPMARETLAVRMSVAMRLWKQYDELRGAVPLLIDILRGEEADALHDPPSQSHQATPPSIVRKARQKAAEALGKMVPPANAAVAALHKALQDEDSDIRQAAAEALQRIDNAAIVRPGHEPQKDHALR